MKRGELARAGVVLCGVAAAAAALGFLARLGFGPGPQALVLATACALVVAALVVWVAYRS